jgi:hypothetical protein
MFGRIQILRNVNKAYRNIISRINNVSTLPVDFCIPYNHTDVPWQTVEK